jgi:hypothetical protein
VVERIISMTIGRLRYTGGERELQKFAQAEARSARAVRQMRLDRYGVRQVEVAPGAVLYSVDGRPELCLTVDEALSHVGLCLIVGIGGETFIEPWEGSPTDEECGLPRFNVDAPMPKVKPPKVEPTEIPPPGVAVLK